MRFIMSTASSTSSSSEYPTPIRIALDIIYTYNSRSCSEGYNKELSDLEEKTLRIAHGVIRKALTDFIYKNTSKPSSTNSENELIVGVFT